MGEASFLHKFSLGIEHAGHVKPLTKVDTNEEVLVELIHEQLIAARACDVASAPVLALEAQLPGKKVEGRDGNAENGRLNPTATPTPARRYS